MFSTGQVIFAAAFFVVFVSIVVMQYLKDKNLHKKNYKGVFWVLISFIGFIFTIILIKHYIIS